MDDREDDQRRTEQLGRGQRLAQHDPPEQRRDDRAEQPQERQRADRQPLDAPEPQGVGNPRPHQRQPRRGRQVHDRVRRRRPLDQECERQQQGPTRGQLPAGHRQQSDRAAPPLGEDHTDRHGQRPGQRGEHADRVQRGVGTEDQQRDAGHTGGTSDGGPSAERLAEQHRGEAGHDHRLDRTGRRGHPAGQAVGGHEEQGEERPDVEGAEDEGTPPPVAAGQRAGPRQEEQAGGKGPERRHEQGAARGQQLGRDDVRAAPDHRGERRGQERSAYGPGARHALTSSWVNGRPAELTQDGGNPGESRPLVSRCRQHRVEVRGAAAGDVGRAVGVAPGGRDAVVGVPRRYQHGSPVVEDVGQAEQGGLDAAVGVVRRPEDGRRLVGQRPLGPQPAGGVDELLELRGGGPEARGRPEGKAVRPAQVVQRRDGHVRCRVGMGSPRGVGVQRSGGGQLGGTAQADVRASPPRPLGDGLCDPVHVTGGAVVHDCQTGGHGCSFLRSSFLVRDLNAWRYGAIPSKEVTFST